MKRSLSSWNVNLINDGITYTCNLANSENNSRKRLEIGSPGETDMLVAIVEPKSEGLYLKEITMQGHTVPFEDSILIPANIQLGDTWSVSAQKSNLLLKLTVTMELQAVETIETDVIAIAVDLQVKATSFFEKFHKEIGGTIWIDSDFKPVKLKLANSEVFVTG